MSIMDANLGVSASSFRISASLNSNGLLIRNGEALNVFVTYHLYAPVINRYTSFLSLCVLFLPGKCGFEDFSRKLIYRLDT